MKLNTSWRKNLGEWLFAAGFVTTGVAFVISKVWGLPEDSALFKTLYGIAYAGGAIMLVGWIVVFAKYLERRSGGKRQDEA